MLMTLKKTCSNKINRHLIYLSNLNKLKLKIKNMKLSPNMLILEINLNQVSRKYLFSTSTRLFRYVANYKIKIRIVQINTLIKRIVFKSKLLNWNLNWSIILGNKAFHLVKTINLPINNLIINKMYELNLSHHSKLIRNRLK